MHPLMASVAALALWSSAAQAVVESKCVTPTGAPTGLIEILPTPQDERRRPCRGDESEIKTQIAAVNPSSRAIRTGLIPRGVVEYSGTFRRLMDLENRVRPKKQTSGVPGRSVEWSRS